MTPLVDQRASHPTLGIITEFSTIYLLDKTHTYHLSTRPPECQNPEYKELALFGSAALSTRINKHTMQIDYLFTNCALTACHFGTVHILRFTVHKFSYIYQTESTAISQKLTIIEKKFYEKFFETSKKFIQIGIFLYYTQ